MHDYLIFTLLSLFLVVYLLWGFLTLADERWQFIATIPGYKRQDGSWTGINFTWYGLLTANAYLMAILILIVLLGSLGIPTVGIASLICIILAICVPSSRIVAKVVEGKKHTFTVGGAVFVGVLITPAVVFVINETIGKTYGFTLPLIASYAAIAIAYAFGEGLGRLACISFGCCYGKPLHELDGTLQKIFYGRTLQFFGATKKSIYADNLEGVALFSIQALTSLIYTSCGLITMMLFTHGHYFSSFILASSITQGWRALSEVWRADYRGGGRFSAYQVMGILGICFASVVVLLAQQNESTKPILIEGLRVIWQPSMFIFLQFVWLIIFIYTGRSTVTGARLRYHVHHENI